MRQGTVSGLFRKNSMRGDFMKLRTTGMILILMLAFGTLSAVPQAATEETKACACCPHMSANGAASGAHNQEKAACCAKHEKGCRDCCASKDGKMDCCKTATDCCGGKDAKMCAAKDGKGCCAGDKCDSKAAAK
jgi:hypothetical protein